MSNPNTTVSPNMSLPVPNLADPGPDYASNVTAALNTIDGHAHTGGPTDGKQLDLSKQTVGGDVQLNGHNLGTTRSVEFQSQPSGLIGSQDVNCLYVNNGILGFNNSAGTFIPLTGTSALQNLTNFSAVTTTTNHIILATDTVNFVGCDTTSNPITITVPRASTILPTPQWRMYVIKDIKGHAGTNAITIAVTGGSGDTFAFTSATSVTIQTAMGYIAVVTDGASLWYMWDQTTYNNGDTLDIHNGTLNFSGSPSINGSASMTLTLAGTLSLSMQSGSNLSLAGCPLTLDNTSTVSSPANSSVTFGVNSSISIAATGSTTLTGTQYNNPVIVLAAVSLTGTVTILFPPTVGSFWMLDCSALTFNGHSVLVGTSHAGASTYTLTTGSTKGGMFAVTSLTTGLVVPSNN